MEIAVLILNDEAGHKKALETYAMYKFLKKEGNEVQIVDYNFKCKNKKKNRMLYNFLSKNTVLTYKEYDTIFEFEENLPLADRFIITNAKSKECELALTGQNNLAYGINELSKDELKKIREKYLAVSTSFNMMSQGVPEVLSPMFLLSRQDWYDVQTIKSTLDDYILVYSKKITKSMIKYANILSKMQNIKICIIGDETKGLFTKKKLNITNPFELVLLISNATDVITSEDEAINLSIIFEKRLHIFTTKENEQLELIENAGIENRIVSNDENIITYNMNYDKIHENLKELKENSIDFLRK